MRRLFYGNFDFEETLAEPGRQRKARSRQQLLAELAPVWTAAARPGDLIWCLEPIDSTFFQRLGSHGLPQIQGVSRLEDVPVGCALVPWGWSEQAVRFAEQVGASVNAPPLDAVRQVNSRAFSHALEQQSEALGIPVQEVSNETELLIAITRLTSGTSGWVVKAEFGNSSRGRFRQQSGRADWDRLQLWAANRLGTGQRLYVEPWLDRISEVGIQWELPHSGEPVLVGVTGLLTDAAGRFRGCDFTPGPEGDPFWQPAIAATREGARCVQDLGYFGPLGVDAMCYHDTRGQTRLRAFQDINARWTIGRLSLAFRPVLRGGERGCWHQCTAAERADFAPGSRILLESPETIGGRPARLRYSVVIDNTS